MGNFDIQFLEVIDEENLNAKLLMSFKWYD